MRFDYHEGADHLRGLSEEEALNQLSKPTLLRIKGDDSTQAVLISTLIHGCEPCGFRAFLDEINSQLTYPYDVYFFVGNVASAQIKPLFTHRLVPGGQNFNRVWIDNPTTEAELTAQEVLAFITKLPLKGVLDIHSFTAKDTPPHGFIPNNKPETLHLAEQLLPVALVTDMPMGALVQQTQHLAPSLVVECGTNGTQEADEYARSVLSKFFVAMGLNEGDNEKICRAVYDNMTNIKVKADATVAWGDTPDPSADITLRPDANTLNLTTVEPGTLFAYGDVRSLALTSKEGRIDPSFFFETFGNKIYLKRRVVPNLLSTNERIIKESGFYFFQPTK